MAVLFMKIDTNCDGTVDWVRNAYLLLLAYIYIVYTCQINYFCL